MKQSAKANYIFNISYQIFALLVPLVTTPYISRVLGADGIGSYSYTYSIVRYFWILSAIGIATYGAKTIGIHQESRKERSQSFWDIFSLKVILSAIMIGLYYLYVIFIAEDKLIASVQSIYLYGVLFDISWFYQGMEDFKKISIRNFIIKTISVIFIFVFVRDKNDLALYIIGLASFQALGSMSLWISLKKHIDIVKIRELKPLSCLKPSLILFIPSIATQIFAILDKTMIGRMTSSMFENGYYEQAFKVVDMLMIIVTSLSTIMIPIVSREHKNGNTELVKAALNKSFKFVVCLGLPMCAGLILVAPIFVPWFFSDEYIKATPILQVLSILFIFMGINSVSGNQYLISTNQTNKHIVMLLVGGAVNIGINLILIPKISALGAAYGSLLGEVVITVLELSYLHFSHQYSIGAFLKNIWKFAVAVLLMSGAGFLVQHFMPSKVYTMIAIAIVCVPVYFGSLVLMKEQFVLEEIKVILKKLKK